jgi:putative phosphoribosyl transferase
MRLYSPGEIEEMVSEYRGVIEQQKLEKLHEMHEMLGKSSLIRRDLLDHRNIMLVSDGLSNGFSIDLALSYLKRVPYKKLIVVTPLASIAAVDRMHILADDIFCLSAIEDYMDTDHYYDTKDVPPHDVVIETVAGIIKNWK